MKNLVAVIVKLMPDSPAANLQEIKTKAKEALEKEGALNITAEENPLAFGLIALYLKFAWPEEQDTSIIEQTLLSLPNVSSLNIEDYRRIFG